MCDWSPSSADDTNLIITVSCTENRCGIKRVSPDPVQRNITKRFRRDSPTSMTPTESSGPFHITLSEQADCFLQSLSNELTNSQDSVPNEISQDDTPKLESFETSIAERKKNGRCMYFPNCSNQNCSYFHPTEPCNNFLSCIAGPTRCLFIHPPCKFQSRCTRRGCAFSHAHETLNDCKHGFACAHRTNGCAFRHPLEQCKFVDKCRNQEMCMYSHASRCQFGLECRTVGCSLSHAPSKRGLSASPSSSPSSPFSTFTSDSSLVINIGRDSL